MDLKDELNFIKELVAKNFQSKSIIITDHNNEIDHLQDWRKKLNPFIFNGFIHNSCYSFFNKDEGNNQSRNDTSLIIDGEKIDIIKPENSSGVSYKTVDSNVVKEQADENNKDLGLYYIENFKFIINDVLNNIDTEDLFSENEHKVLKLFDNLTLQSQMLYVRLFQRKRNWIRVEKIKYAEIEEDQTILSAEELCKNGFLQSEESCNDFDDIMSLLSLQDVKTLVTEFKMTKSTSKMGKGDLIKVLKDSCKKQKILFFSKDNSMKNIILKRAKKLLGHCIKVKNDFSEVFSQIITYFSMHFTIQENPSDSILYTLLQMKLGQIVFPHYMIQKKTKIFHTRQEFIRYAKAVELEKDFFALMDVNDYENAYHVFIKVVASLKICLENQEIAPEKTPLLRFSEQYVLAQLCRQSIILLEKKKKYNEAVLLVEILLQFSFFKAKHRGMLWERKIIDLDRHLKDIEKAFQSIQMALDDANVRSGFRLSLMQRLERFKRKKIESTHLEELHNLVEIKEECIKAEIVLDTTSSNRAIFKSNDASGDSMSCVEQFVLNHYHQNGFKNGVHDEGGVVMTLFVLMFWDIIFSNVPDAFHCPYQSCPHDFSTDQFYTRRKKAIDSRLKWIYFATDEALGNILSKSWNANYGKTCMGANWDHFQSKQDMIDAAVCLGSQALGGICELYCKDLHSRRGGFPDLFVWNIESKSAKIIEVKGPGDKLSTKQIIWLQILHYLGVDAIVCHVTGVGAKRKRIST